MLCLKAEHQMNSNETSEVGRMKKTKAVLLGVILWSLLLISGCNFIRIEKSRGSLWSIPL